MASVARVRRDKADGAVQVLAVIPVGEGFHPSLGICFRGKAFGRPVLLGQSGRYLQVRNSASENGLSLLTRGRL